MARYSRCQYHLPTKINTTYISHTSHLWVLVTNLREGSRHSALDRVRLWERQSLQQEAIQLGTECELWKLLT